MTREEIADVICKTVMIEQGCVPSKLLTYPELRDCEYDVTDIIDTLINQRRLVAIEYVLPQMDYRVKMHLFPAGTKITVSE